MDTFVIKNSIAEDNIKLTAVQQRRQKMIQNFTAKNMKQS